MGFVVYACDGCRVRLPLSVLFVPMIADGRGLGLFCGGCKQERERAPGLRFRPALWWLAA